MSNNNEVSHYVVDRLAEEGFSVNREQLSMMNAQNQSSVPWYLHALLGFGVYVAFCLFALLLAISEFGRMEPTGQSFFAITFIALAIFIYRSVIMQNPLSETLGKVVAIQVSLTLMVTGQGVLFYSICEYFSLESYSLFTVVALVILAMTFPFYRVKLSQILSVACVAFLGLLTTFQFATITSLFSSLYFLIMLLAFVYLSVRSLNYSYLRYALGIAILTYFSFSQGFMSYARYDVYIDDGQFGVAYPAIMVALALIVCIAYFAQSWQDNYMLWSLALALLVLAYFIPATLFFAVLIMVIGYGTYDKVMLSFGTLLLPYYLFKYYYDLQMTLLDKSFLLAASGLVLVVIAAVIHKTGLHEENES